MQANKLDELYEMEKFPEKQRHLKIYPSRNIKAE